MTDNRQKLINSAISIIASEGITNFSMRKVTESVGVSEALIYKYFDTKDNFLYCCFETVHKDIAAIFNNIDSPSSFDYSSLIQYIRDLWFLYFDFLVSNGNRTIFYFEYRNSPYIRTILENDEKAREEYFGSFVRIFSTLKKSIGLPIDFDEDILWTFLLDVSGMYAIRLIRGDIKDSLSQREQIWKLISEGILGCLPK